MGKRHLQRLRRADGLRVPPTKRRLVRRGVSTGLPTKATHRRHVWAWDFLSDATIRGGTLRMLTSLHEHTRECQVRRSKRTLRASDVLGWLKRAIKEHGVPAFLRSDKGPEFIAREVQSWLAANQIKTIPHRPRQPLAERLRGELPQRAARRVRLHREQLWTLTEARLVIVIGDYRQHYNHARPHSKLGYQSLVRFAAQNHHSVQQRAGHNQQPNLPVNQPQS